MCGSIESSFATYVLSWPGLFVSFFLGLFDSYHPIRHKAPIKVVGSGSVVAATDLHRRPLVGIVASHVQYHTISGCWHLGGTAV